MNSTTSGALILAFTALLAGGCAAAVTRVTIEPSTDRSEQQLQEDSARCADAVSDVSQESLRTREYAACVLARGYRVTMPFQAGVEHARLSVGAPAGRTAAAVAADLAACQDAAAAVRPGAADVVAGQYGGLVHTSDSTQVRPHTAETPALANQLASCLCKRGYDAR